MVNNRAARLDRVFSALGDPTRRAILERLARGQATVTEVAKPLPISLPAVSKHLRILEQAGLIARQKQGRIHHLSLSPAAMKDAAEWLERYRQFWGDQLDNLAGYLESQPERRGRR